MKYITWINKLVIATTLVCSPLYLVSIGGMDMGNFSMEELEEASRMIEDYVSSLSPEEQEAFNRQVNEWEQMFENMSDDELDEFLGAMFNEEPMPEQQYDSYGSSFPEASPVQVPQLTVEEKNKIDTLIKTINDIIRDTNILQVHIASSIELPFKIDQWISKKTIQSNDENSTWDTIRIEIEKFTQMLYKLQNKDQTNGEYLYLTDTLEDQALVDALIELRNTLNQSVFSMDHSLAGMTDMNNSSKDKVKSALSQYTNSLYITNIPKMIVAIFEKNSAKETKLKETEEVIEQRAAEAARRTKTPVSASTAGTSDESSRGYSSGYDSSYGYDSYPSYSSGSSYYDSSYSPSSYDYDDYGSGSSKKDFDMGGGSKGGSSSSEGSSEGSSAIGKKSQQQQKQVSTSNEDTTKARIKSFSSNVKDATKEIATLIQEKQLLMLEEHITKDEATSPVESEIANALATLNQKLTALLGDLGQLGRVINTATKENQSYYSASLETAIQQSIGIIKSFYDTVAKVITYQKTKGLSQITPEKQWAYFKADDKILEKVKSGKDAESTAEEKVAKLKANVKERVSLDDLAKVIEECLTKLASFKKLIIQQQPNPQPQPQPEEPISE